MRLSLGLAVPLILLLAGCVDGLNTSNRSCPCATGWHCCEGELICVSDPADCPEPEACDDQCGDGEQRCDGNTAQICEYSNVLQCLRWRRVEDCGDGQFCDSGECRCLERCSPGASLCTATPGYQTCELDAGTGCHDWSAEIACDAGWTCDRGRCVRGCIDQCSAGERWCDGSAGTQTCELDPTDGCYNWSATAACAEDQVCRKGICLARTCVEGTNQPGPEVCDRADNDCDGLVDEPELTRLGDLFLGGQLTDIALDGDVAYLANGYGLVVYDISQPSSPTLIGRLATPGYANGIAVDSGFVYLSDARASDEGTPSGIRIIDVSAPALPVDVGFIAVEASARSLDVSGGLLVTAYYGLARVFDVSSPSAPREIGSVELPESVPGVNDHHVLVSDVAIQGDAVYLAGGTMTLTLDISDPTDPKLAQELLLRSFSIALDADHAYLGDTIDGLYVLDLADPLAAREVGSLQFSAGGVLSHLHASDGRVMLATSTALVAVDVGDPTAPRELGQMVVSELYGGPLAVSGDHAFVAAAAYNSKRSYLSVVEISDPTGMTRVGRASEARRIGSLAVDGDSAVITERRWDGDEYEESHILHVVDASRPDSPVVMGSLDLDEHGRTSRAAVLDGDFSYHVDQHGMYAVDLRDPSSPTMAGYFGHPPGFPGDYTYNLHTLTVADQTAYMVGQRGEFWTSDLSDPAAPGPGGFVSLPNVGAPAAIAVKGRHAYVLVESESASRTSLLAIDLDGGGPDSPLQTASVVLDEHGFLMVFWPRSMAIHQDRLYVAGGTSDLVVLSLADPAAPVELGRIALDDAPRHVALSYPLALVSDSRSVHVIDVSDPASMYLLDVPDQTAYQSARLALSGDLLFVDDGADLSLHRFGGCTDPVICTDDCERGASRCESNAVELCTIQADGCTDWSDPVACEASEYCSEGACRCLDLCSPGSGLCTDTPGFQTCELQPGGCYDWSEETGCDQGWTCSEGRCVHGCIDQCAPADRWCDGTAGFQSCEMQDNGCYGWSPTVGCEQQQVCREGWCLPVGCVDGTITPADEWCNGEDDDCDGSTDELEIERLSDTFFSGSHNDLAARGDRLFVADDYGLLIYDLAAPGDPTLIGRSATPGSARRIAVTEEYAFVGDTGAVHVIDLRYPPWYTIIETIPTRTPEYFSLDASGGYLIIGYTDRSSMNSIVTTPLVVGIDVYDVSSPTQPVLLGALDFEEQLVSDVAVAGEFGYIAAADGLHVVHFSDPAGPREIGSVITDPLLRLAVAGASVHATDSTGTLTVFDIADPAHPTVASTLELLDHQAPLSFSHASIDVSSSRGVVTLDDSLVVLDLADPSQPKLVGRLSEPVCGGAVVVDGDRAWALSGMFGGVIDPRSFICTNALLSIDLGDPAEPRTLMRRENLLKAEAFAAGDGLALVVDSYAHLHVLDLADPAAPQETALLPPQDFTSDIVMRDGHAFLAQGDGLRILDLADPAAPQEVGYYSPYTGSIPGFHNPVLDGDTAYVSAQWGGIWAIDIADLTAPALLGVANLDDYWVVRSMTARDGHAFVVAAEPPHGNIYDQVELRVLDLRDPEAPAQIASLPLWITSLQNSDVAIHGDRLYIADKVFIAVFDISDPASPIELGRIQTGFPESVALRYPYAFAAFGASVQVLDVRDPANIEHLPLQVEVATGAHQVAVTADDLLLVNGGVDLAIHALGGCLLP